MWFPGLAEKLLAASPDCVKGGYTTSRFLGDADPQLIFELAQPIEANNFCLRIEVLSQQIETQFTVRGINLLTVDAVNNLDVRRLMKSAFELIQINSQLAETVCVLAKSVHLIHQSDPSTDVSFSDPSIPFSIFVSVCPTAASANFRLAEAIIHEAMHLQLTLAEGTLVLWEREGSTAYSPWKQSERPLSGLLHSLYVFSVIYEWLGYLLANGFSDQYLQDRRAQISAEVDLIDVAEMRKMLTDDGSILLEKICG